MTVHRTTVATDPYTSKITIRSAVVLIIAALVCWGCADIRLAIAAEPKSAWPQLSEQDKSVIRSRWSTKKIEQVLAALKMPDTPLPVERISAETLVKDLDILARAHGIYGLNAPLNWLLKHHPPPRYSDLRGMPLQDCKLKNANLRYTYLEGADLSRCELKNADLTGANLRGANLSGAILTSAKLDHALLIEADLSGAHLDHASLRQALLYGSTIVDAYLAEADFEGAQFTDFQQTTALKILQGYTGTAEIEQTPLLSPANLSRSNLSGSNLSGAILGNANLERANLYEAMFGDTLIDVRQFDRAYNYRYIKPGASAPSINIPAQALRFAEAFYRESKRFFAANAMGEMAAEYHYWEQEATLLSG